MTHTTYEYHQTSRKSLIFSIITDNFIYNIDEIRQLLKVAQHLKNTNSSVLHGHNALIE